MQTPSVVEIEDMPAAERRLLRAVLATSPGVVARQELELALARLRNLREKYNERAKRARLEARAGLPVESAETLNGWIDCIGAAERHARACLDQEPGPDEAAAPVEAD